jgi:hypothetical protein
MGIRLGLSPHKTMTKTNTGILRFAQNDDQNGDREKIGESGKGSYIPMQQTD